MPKIDDMIDFLLFEKGESIKRNGINERALLLDNSSSFKDYKIIVSNLQLKTGDSIEAEGYKWLVISEVTKDKNSYKATIRKCPYVIKFNFLGNIKEYSMFAETKTMDIINGEFLSIPVNNIFITLPSTIDNIELGQRFIKFDNAYEVTGIDKTKQGLVIIQAEKTAINTTSDDIENEIADRWAYETKHSYVLSALPISASIDEGATQQITISITDNAVEVTSPTITFASDNTSIATVDANGFVNAIVAGTCNVTVTFVGEDGITYSQVIPVTVNVAEITHIITYDLTPTASMGLVIKKSNTNTFTAHKYDNSVEVSTAFDFDIDFNGLSTSAISIVEVTSSYMKVKNVSIDTTTPYKTIFVLYKEQGQTDWLNKEVIVKGIFG